MEDVAGFDAYVPTRDHPRSRGEQFLEIKITRAKEGSPPLARGAGVCQGHLVAVIGITPARAGSR